MSGGPVTSDEGTVSALREQIRVEERPGDGDFPAVLVDPVLEQRVKLDALGWQVVQQLDEPRSFDELARLVSGSSSAGDALHARLSQVVGGFRRMCLLEGERSAAAVAERRRTLAWTDAPSAEIPLHLLSDARFECTGCGGCCGGHNVGPVDGHVVDRLASSEGEAFLAAHGLADGELYVRNAADLGGEHEHIVSLRTIAGWCQFLDAGNRCLLHADFGPTGKPSVCRLFPLAFVLRPDGVAVSLQMECRDILEASRVGPPLVDQQETIRELLGLPQNLERVRPIVLIDGLATLTSADYAVLRAALLETTEAPTPDPIRSLRALREVVDRVGRPRAEGSPAEVERLRTHSELRDALHESVQRLGGELVSLRRSLAGEGDRRIVRLGSLDRVLGGLSRLVPAFDRVLRPPHDPGARSLFRLLVRNALHGEEVASSQRLRHGLTLLALRWILARAIAVDHAYDVKRPEPNAQDHVDGLVAIGFSMRSPRVRDVLAKLSGPLSLLFFDHLGDLAEAAADLAVIDRRAEIFAS